MSNVRPTRTRAKPTLNPPLNALAVDWMIAPWIVDLPPHVRAASWALIKYGVDPQKLRKLLGIHYRPGPRGAPRATKKSRAEPVWNMTAYRTILRIYDEGAVLLRQHGTKLTDYAALLEIYKRDAVGCTLKPSVLREMARRHAKRLPDARKAVRRNIGDTHHN